jgi:hypothetical protein
MHHGDICAQDMFQWNVYDDTRQNEAAAWNKNSGYKKKIRGNELLWPIFIMG